MNTRIMAVALGVVGVACAMVVGMGEPESRGLHGGLQEIVLDAEFHHLGDNFIEPWLIPDPEGTILEITFLLNQGQIQRAKTAHLEFFLLQNDWGNLIVNGRRWTLPETHLTSSGFGLDIAAKTLFSIPTSILDMGLNSIVFESTQHGKNFDDFEFGEVVLLLNK